MVTTYSEGVLSEASMDALTAIPDIGTEIEQGLGGVGGGDFLVSMMADDSLSIRTGEMQSAVINGHNLILSIAREQDAACLLHTRYLNGHVLNPYVAAENAEPMTRSNYTLSPDGTPLYDQSVVLLGTVIAKWREGPPGSRPRTFTVIISDGADTTSRSSPESVKRLVSDMLPSGEHIVAAIGINDGSTDFRTVFGEMGIPQPWILTPDASAEQVAGAFQTIADALALGAGDAQAFRQLTVGPPASRPD